MCSIPYFCILYDLVKCNIPIVRFSCPVLCLIFASLVFFFFFNKISHSVRVMNLSLYSFSLFKKQVCWVIISHQILTFSVLIVWLPFLMFALLSQRLIHVIFVFSSYNPISVKYSEYSRWVQLEFPYFGLQIVNADVKYILNNVDAIATLTGCQGIRLAFGLEFVRNILPYFYVAVSHIRSVQRLDCILVGHSCLGAHCSMLFLSSENARWIDIVFADRFSNNCLRTKTSFV